jgi:hypothetical protein
MPAAGPPLVVTGASGMIGAQELEALKAQFLAFLGVLAE